MKIISLNTQYWFVSFCFSFFRLLLFGFVTDLSFPSLGINRIVSPCLQSEREGLLIEICSWPLLVWLYDSDIPQWDPNGILSWLARELHEAERLGQRAWISELFFTVFLPHCFRFLTLLLSLRPFSLTVPLLVGHMPFGKVDAMRDQSNYANQIFQRYHETIAAQFYGHTFVMLFFE